MLLQKVKMITVIIRMIILLWKVIMKVTWPVPSCLLAKIWRKIFAATLPSSSCAMWYCPVRMMMMITTLLQNHHCHDHICNHHHWWRWWFWRRVVSGGRPPGCCVDVHENLAKPQHSPTLSTSHHHHHRRPELDSPAEFSLCHEYTSKPRAMSKLIFAISGIPENHLYYRPNTLLETRFILLTYFEYFDYLKCVKKGNLFKKAGPT